MENLLPYWAFLVAQMVKRLAAMQETQVWSLGWEDLLEKEMATYSSTLAWRIPRMEEPGRLQSMGSQRVRHDWATSLLHFITILFKYKTNQTETDIADGSYSHKYNFKWPTPYSPGTGNTFHSISGYGHFLPYENDDHFCPRIYSGCFTCLILIRLYINPTCYNLSFQFCIRKDWGLDELVCLNIRAYK